MPQKRFILAGLGNPGAGYSRTRHNVGFWVADILAARAGVFLRTGPGPCEWTEGELAGSRIVLVKPMTFMNRSGAAVRLAVRKWPTPTEGIIVIHDDLDLDPGVVRLKRGGGEGGHNGLKSISMDLGTKDYYRVRIGIGRPPGHMDAADYVLKTPPPDIKALLEEAAEKAADLVEFFLREGPEAAMNQFHRKA